MRRAMRSSFAVDSSLPIQPFSPEQSFAPASEIRRKASGW